MTASNGTKGTVARTGLGSVDEVVTTEELARRPSRPADHAAEARALRELARVMAESPRDVLQKLADTALSLCRADSAGVSIAETEGEAHIFRWRATAGAFTRYLGGTMPRGFSPCGTVLDRNATQLMANPVRHFPYIEDLCSPVSEVLLVPFYQGGTAVGTVWVVSHTPGKRFEAEDARLVTSLADFAGAAVGTLTRMEESERAWKELRSSEERQWAILESITDCFLAVDRDWRITYVNAAAERSYGQGREHYLGKSYWEMFPGVDESVFGAEYRRVMRDRVPAQVEGYYEPFDSWFEVNVYRAGDGGVSFFFRDVTGRKRSEAELRASEERFRALVTTTSDVMYRMSPDWAELLPLDGRGLVAGNDQPIHNWLEKNIPAFEHERVRAAIARVISTREPFELEHQVIRPDGTLGWTHSRAVPIVGSDGEVIEWFGSATDITERKRAQAAARESAERLGAALRVARLGTFEWDLTTNQVTFDDRSREIFGFQPGEGTTAREVFGRIHPDDVLRVQSEAQASERDLSRLETEYRIVLPDGSVRRVVSFNDVIRGPGGRAEGTFGVFGDVTDRWLAAEDLARLTAESEQRKRLYETILSSTPDLVYVFDLDHRFTYANDVLLRMWGKSWDEAIGKNCLELGYEPWHAEMHDREIEQVKATKKPIRGEVPFAGTFGRRIYDYIFVPVLGPDGEVEAVAGTTRDVTERKEAEEGIRASAERFRAIVNQATAGVAQVDFAGRFTLVNPRYCELLGYTEKELLSMRMQDVTHPDDLTRNQEQFQALASGGPDFVIEKRYVRKDGSAVWVSNSVTAMRDADGALEGVLAVSLDLTDRLRAEELVRENERRFREMADTAPVALWTTDPDGTCTFLSREWYEVTGQTEEEALGLGWTRATHPDDQERAGEEFMAATTTRSTFRSEYRLRTKDGSYRWAMDVGRPRYSSEGDFLGMVGAVFDLEEKKQAELALKEADRRKDEFLATLAHELRNPLAPIRTGLTVLKSSDPQDSARVVRMMDRQLGHMVRLIDDLLDVSRVSRGRIELKRERVQLRSVLESAVEATHASLRMTAHVMTRTHPRVSEHEIFHEWCRHMNGKTSAEQLLAAWDRFKVRPERYGVRAAGREGGVPLYAGLKQLGLETQLFSALDRLSRQQVGGLSDRVVSAALSRQKGTTAVADLELLLKQSGRVEAALKVTRPGGVVFAGTRDLGDAVKAFRSAARNVVALPGRFSSSTPQRQTWSSSNGSGSGCARSFPTESSSGRSPSTRRLAASSAPSCLIFPPWTGTSSPTNSKTWTPSPRTASTGGRSENSARSSRTRRQLTSRERTWPNTGFGSAASGGSSSAPRRSGS